MNEIKAGDTVRVSEKIPQFYRKYNSMRMLEQAFRVVDIEDGLALLVSTSILMYKVVLPTKYLVKVNAEPKEQTIKVGDKVRVISAYTPETKALLNGVGEILDINKNGDCYVLFHDTQAWIYKTCLEPCTEPTERIRNISDLIERKQCEHFIRKISQEDFLKEFDPTEHKVATEPYFDWQRYTADLAKEIAVKITNKKMDSDPEEVGGYAVAVAEAVVENLKKE